MNTLLALEQTTQEETGQRLINLIKKREKTTEHKVSPHGQ